ncbi:MAG TPA: hypothetical protein PKV98_04510 [Burkholderiaceae bacterium]|nr:hypothetical protein [Burkholderiaceae bacterium]
MANPVFQPNEAGATLMLKGIVGASLMDFDLMMALCQTDITPMFLGSPSRWARIHEELEATRG